MGQTIKIIWTDKTYDIYLLPDEIIEKLKIAMDKENFRGCLSLEGENKKEGSYTAFFNLTHAKEIRIYENNS